MTGALIAISLGILLVAAILASAIPRRQSGRQIAAGDVGGHGHLSVSVGDCGDLGGCGGDGGGDGGGGD
jgi:hypothetical protein